MFLGSAFMRFEEEDGGGCCLSDVDAIGLPKNLRDPWTIPYKRKV